MEITLGSLLRQDLMQAFSYLVYSIPAAALTAFLSWLYHRRQEKMQDGSGGYVVLNAVCVSYLIVILFLTLLNREAGSR